MIIIEKFLTIQLTGTDAEMFTEFLEKTVKQDNVGVHKSITINKEHMILLKTIKEKSDEQRHK